jgi:integrase
MKMREPHIVPLSRQALELLRELHALTGGDAGCSTTIPNFFEVAT